jgi:two-component system, OmpR family, phosphate regulon sensor histidine kinase PhoR
MKTLNARIMAMYAALLAAAVSGAAEILSRAGSGLGFSPLIAVSVILVFGAVYLLVYFMLTSFIYNKINPIYNTISNLKESETKLQKELDKKDMIEDLNREVEDWATSKTREIDQLKEMELYRKEFLGNVSHEIKTPLYNVQGYIANLLDGGLEDPAVNRVYLERAEKSMNRLINIVSDLDIISGLDSGEVKIHFENFDIVQLVRDIFELQEMRAQAMGISLKLKNHRESTIMVHADRRRIQEALINLVVNSIKYGNQDGCTSVGFTDLEDKVLIEVSDNGLGIPADDIPRVFERFYRVNKSRSRNQGGTGLGLAIVKHVVEAHNQAIRVKSKEGKGTTFSFALRKGRQE